jgi:hypothetical protein
VNAPAVPRTTGAYDDADLSALSSWSGTAADRQRVFPELRRERPVSWHAPVGNGLFEDPNDEGFAAVVRNAHVVEATKRHGDFLSGDGMVRLLRALVTSRRPVGSR